MNRSHQQRGFIALMSAIIIAAVLVVLMLNGDLSSFYARIDALGSEGKRAARAQAQACIEVALLALATSTDPLDYDPRGEVISIGNDSQGNPLNCTINDVTHDAATITIDAFASSDDSYSTVSATVSFPPDIQIRSTDESP